MNIANGIFAFLLPPAAASGWYLLLSRMFRRLPWRQRDWLAGWGCSAGFGTGYGLFHPDWPWFLGSGASLTVVLAVWFWRSRRRKRATALLGAKSRALRDALIRTMRRERRPSRVLRPHPVPS